MDAGIIPVTNTSLCADPLSASRGAEREGPVPAGVTAGYTISPSPLAASRNNDEYSRSSQPALGCPRRFRPISRFRISFYF
ncbi:MAG TPA: hypothetical protein VFI53_17240, partial [Myxococcaceae bacterium]|nr:hypothetical protein [Myxococcaceae bacterium]